MDHEQLMDLLMQPMREELTRIGFRELRDPAEVDDFMRQARGTTLLFINSMCGCAGGTARPAAALALQRARTRPDHLVTVFASADREATARARSYLDGYPPSSPSIFLLKDGRVVFALERSRIEGRTVEEVAADLAAAIDAQA